MAEPRSLLKGFLSNLDAGLFLPFMINPRPVSVVKNVSWDIEEIPGLSAPIHTFQSGGQKIISFQLFFDVSEISQVYKKLGNVFPDNALRSLWGGVIDATSLRGIEAIIDSMLYPQSVSLGYDENKKKILNKGGLLPPPKMFLFMGLRFWEGYVVSAPMEETRFDGALNPLQLKVDLEFSVVEDGWVNDLNRTFREQGGRVASGLNVLNYGGDSISLNGGGANNSLFDISIDLRH